MTASESSDVSQSTRSSPDWASTTSREPPLAHSTAARSTRATCADVVEQVLGEAARVERGAGQLPGDRAQLGQQPGRLGVRLRAGRAGRPSTRCSASAIAGRAPASASHSTRGERGSRGRRSRWSTRAEHGRASPAATPSSATSLAPPPVRPRPRPAARPGTAASRRRPPPGGRDQRCASPTCRTTLLGAEAGDRAPRRAGRAAPATGVAGRREPRPGSRRRPAARPRRAPRRRRSRRR